MSTTKDFIDSIQAASKERTSAYDTTATVKRVEGNTAWVHIPGGVEETPVKLTMNAKEGDNVQVRVSDGRAFLLGNATSPPTDDTTALEAKGVANKAAEEAGRAKTAADIAESYATSAQCSAEQSAQILEGMEQAAEAAGTTLDGIYADAAEAKATTDEINAYADTAEKTVTQILNDGETAGAAAQAATEAADSALYGLSTVEDVVGVLNWITARGTMTSQAGGTYDANQVYFIMDDATPGDYHVGAHYYSIVSEPDPADIDDYYVLTVDESVQNYVATHIVVDSEGLWIVPDAGGNKVLIATGAGSTYTTAGTYIVGKVGGVDTVLAKFTASGAQVGENASGKSRTEVSPNGMEIIRNDGGSDVKIATLGYGSGNSSSDGTSNKPYYTFGQRKKASSEYDSSATYYKGDLCLHDGIEYVCKYNNITGAWSSSFWQLSHGNWSIAEGYNIVASGTDSHAEGFNTEAIGKYSHSEGEDTLSAGIAAHAEGMGTYADSNGAHAEGAGTRAEGYYSHTGGSGTRTRCKSQTVIGEYNELDPDWDAVYKRGRYAAIIGNGANDNARSNALTVDWSGNVEAAGGADLAAMTESSGTYSGGLNDEALLTSATITKLEAWLNS